MKIPKNSRYIRLDYLVRAIGEEAAIQIFRQVEQIKLDEQVEDLRLKANRMDEEQEQFDKRHAATLALRAEGKTFEEIGHAIGVKAQRASQIYKRALRINKTAKVSENASA